MDSSPGGFQGVLSMVGQTQMWTFWHPSSMQTWTDLSLGPRILRRLQTFLNLNILVPVTDQNLVILVHFHQTWCIVPIDCIVWNRLRMSSDAFGRSYSAQIPTQESFIVWFNQGCVDRHFKKNFWQYPATQIGRKSFWALVPTISCKEVYN